jgi:DNA-binding NtrC family response regulator
LDTLTSIPILPYFKTLYERERDAIKEALNITDNRVSESARLLGVSRAGLYYKIKEHSLTSMMPRRQRNDHDSNTL